MPFRSTSQSLQNVYSITIIVHKLCIGLQQWFIQLIERIQVDNLFCEAALSKLSAGAGINKGKVIDELCVTDIAPLIAKLLGVGFTSPDGRLVEGNM